MADRQETVRYRLEVDDSGIPDEIQQGGTSRRRPRQLPGDGNGGGYGSSRVSVRRLDTTTDITRVFAQVMRAPNFPGMLAESAMIFLNKPGAMRERAQAAAQATQQQKAGSQLEATLRKFVPMLANIGQVLWGARGVARGGRQILSSGLFGNATGALQGGILAAGGVGHMLAGGAGLAIGGPAGMAVGGGLGLAVTALSRSLAGLVDVTDKLSTTFSRYNAGIAASQASVTVATLQNNIRLANATEPLILAFNRLKITALDTAGALAAGLVQRFGGTFEGMFSRIDEWIKNVAGHFGINLSASGSNPFTAGSMSKAFTAAAGQGVLTGGEMFRGRIGGTLFGGDDSHLARAQADLATKVLNQREYVRALDAQSPQTPAEKAFVEQERNKLAALEKRYTNMRAQVGTRYAGQGSPIAGRAPNIRHREGDMPLDKVGRIQAEMARITADLNRPLDDPFWKDPRNNRPVDAAGIQVKRAKLSERMNELRSELYKLTHRSAGSSTVDPALAREESKLINIQMMKHDAERKLKELEDINPARRNGHVMDRIDTLRETVKHLKQSEADESSLVEGLRRRQHLRSSVTPPVPFSGIDINQRVNFNLNMQLAHAKQVHEAIGDIRRELTSGINQSRDETRLALSVARVDRGAVA